MGAYVSRGECKSHYGVVLNCSIGAYPNKTIYSLGDIQKGQFEGDGDIAGIGIFGTFIAVTSFALLLSLAVVIFGMIQHKVFPFQHCGDGCFLVDRTTGPADPTENETNNEKIKPGVSEIFQAMVLSCSDAQIFTGAAYALTLRYFRGCTITAYHYNVVANLMLLTCATHLMAITIVRNYWEYVWLALLRVVCKTGVFLVTGLLLSNQNADLENTFPARIPPRDDTTTPLFLAAACFQSNETELGKTIWNSVQGDNAKNAFVFSTPGNRIEGWNKFLIILFWYIVAVAMEIAMYIRKGNRRDGFRRKMVRAFWHVMVKLTRRTVECIFPKKKRPAQEILAQDTTSPGNRPRITPADRTSTIPGKTPQQRTIRHLKLIGHYVLSLYYLFGIGICMWTVVGASSYVGNLKQWVQDSGWLNTDEYGLNPENDATSFGQLVPIFTSGLVLFTLLEMISAALSSRRDARDMQRLRDRHDGEHLIPQPPQSPYKIQYTSEVKPVLPTPSLDPTPTEPSTDEITPAPNYQETSSIVPSYFPPPKLDVSVTAEPAATTSQLTSQQTSLQQTSPKETSPQHASPSQKPE
ncbi:hypothetical protein AUP68_07237 [Ilyonectria robusta]